VPETVRSTVLGIVSAAGSLGALLSAPIGQVLAQDLGWRAGLTGFVVLALAMVPAAWFAGKVDKVPLPKPSTDQLGNVSAGIAVTMAFGNPSFVVMTCAYFVCGIQLVFITTQVLCSAPHNTCNAHQIVMQSLIH
jgi:MFS family permease